MFRRQDSVPVNEPRKQEPTVYADDIDALNRLYQQSARAGTLTIKDSRGEYAYMPSPGLLPHERFGDSAQSNRFESGQPLELGEDTNLHEYYMYDKDPKTGKEVVEGTVIVHRQESMPVNDRLTTTQLIPEAKLTQTISFTDTGARREKPVQQYREIKQYADGRTITVDVHVERDDTGHVQDVHITAVEIKGDQRQVLLDQNQKITGTERGRGVLGGTSIISTLEQSGFKNPSLINEDYIVGGRYEGFIDDAKQKLAAHQAIIQKLPKRPTVS